MEEQIVDTVQEPQSVVAARDGLKATNKLIGEAVGISIFVAIVNIALGAVLSIFPGILESYGFDGGFGFVIFGLLYMGMACGIQKRSRVCAIIALVVFAADAILTMIDGNGVAGYAMKVVIIVGLVQGLRGCFQYHTLVRKAKSELDDRPLEILQADKRTIKTKWFVIFGIIAALGLGCGVYDIASTLVTQSFEQWETYTSADGVVTMKVPCEMEEQTESIPNMPGVKYRVASGATMKYESVLISYEGIISAKMQDQAEEMDRQLMNAFIQQSGGTAEPVETVEFDGITALEVRATIEGREGVLRTFHVDDTIYVVGMFQNPGQETDTIDQFLSSISVK